jgi:hypothetical protein
MAAKKKAVKKSAKKPEAVKLPIITLIEAFDLATSIVSNVRAGYNTAEEAIVVLTELSDRANQIPGVSFSVPTLADLKTIAKEPEYESSYEDSNCW